MSSFLKWFGKSSGNRNYDTNRLKNYESLPIMSAAELIDLTGQYGRLRNIKRIIRIDDARYQILYQDVIDRFAELVQLMPASQSHHHAVPGGLFIHTLEVIEYAITLRQQYKLPQFAAQEVQEAQRHLWTYAIFVAAILHDVGKRLTLGRFHISNKNRYIEPFTPISTLQGEHYRIVFHDTKYHSIHEKIGLVFVSALLPPVGLNFLLPQLHVMKELMEYVHEEKHGNGIIGQILRLADQKSTGQSLAHSDSRKFQGASLENIGERLMTQLRQLLASNHFSINRSNGNVYTSADQRYTYILSKTLADELRSTLAAEGITDIPSDNNRIFDILQEYGFAESNADGIIHYICRGWQDKEDTFSVLKFETAKLFRILPPKFSGTVREVPKPKARHVDSTDEYHPIAAKSPKQTGKSNSHKNNATGAEIPKQKTSMEDPFVENTESGNHVEKESETEITPVITEAEQTTGVLKTVTKEETSSYEDKEDNIIDDIPSTPSSSAREDTSATVINDIPIAATGQKQDPHAGAENETTIQSAPEKTEKIEEQIDIAEEFLSWCREKIRKKIFVINESNGIVQKVEYEDSSAIAVVSPRVFMEFAAEILGIPKSKTSAEKVQRAIHKKKLNIPAKKGQIHYYYLKRSESAPLNGYMSLYLYLFSLEKFAGGDTEIMEIMEKTKNNGNLAKKEKY
ncbi:MAG: MobH family relaxase [Cardiobacteriaceae bacterium]|nr:MobH family relaxase [Cardiobacteriaceae bacterium]